MSEGRPRVPRWLTLTVLPAVFWGVVAAFIVARGPFFLGSYDPDYPYLLNALNLAQGIPPEHVDHPGTPVQALGAWFIQLRHPTTSTAEMRAHVLDNAEWYLRSLNYGLVGLILAELLLLPAFVLSRTGHLGPSLALQATPFLLGGSFREIVRFNPEPLLLAVSVALAGLLLVEATGLVRRRALVAGLLGVLVATGVAGKITYLPVALVPLVALRDWRGRGIYLLSTVLAFGLWLVPAAPKVPQFAHWVLLLVTREGRYTQGPEGILPPDYLLEVLRLAASEWWLTGSVVVIVAILWRARSLGEPHLRRLLTGIALAQVAQLLMVAKAPEPRYLLPAEALTGLALATSVELHRRRGGAQGGSAGWPVPAPAAVVLLGVVGSLAALTYHREWADLMETTRGQRRLAEVVEHDLRGATVVLYYGAPSPEYALAFGNWFAGGHYTEHLRARLDASPTRYLFMNKWTGDVWTIDRVVPIGELARLPGPIYWMGDVESEEETFSQLPADARPRRWLEGGQQAIYR